MKIVTCPTLLDGSEDELDRADRWGAFLHFPRELSFHTLAKYFGMFIDPPVDEHPPTPEPPMLAAAEAPLNSPNSLSNRTTTAT
jgi:hypothetical protein